MSSYQEISVDEVYQLHQKGGDLQLVDVREEDEFAASHIPFSQLLPLSQLRDPQVIDRLALDKNKAVYLVCRSGRRSASACEIFSAAGFQKLYNVQGGVLAWGEQGLPLR